MALENPDKKGALDNAHLAALPDYLCPDNVSYTSSLHYGKYVFCAIQIYQTSGPDHLVPGGFLAPFLAIVDQLQSANASLPNALPITMLAPTDAAFVAGWYNTIERTYGFADMYVDTPPTGGVATHAIYNDGNMDWDSGWVILHWRDNAQDIYLHYAKQVQPPPFYTPLLTFSVQVEPPTGSAIRPIGYSIRS